MASGALQNRDRYTPSFWRSRVCGAPFHAAPRPGHESSSLPRPAGLLGGLVGGLLGDAEIVADLAPIGAGAEGAQHGLGLGHAGVERLGHLGERLLLLVGARRRTLVRLSRAPRIGALPAVDVGLVD